MEGGAQGRRRVCVQDGPLLRAVPVTLGLIDNQSVVADYGIPPEVAQSMRPRLRDSR